MVAGADEGAGDPCWRVFRAEDPLSGGSDARSVPIRDLLPPPAREAWVDMEEMMNNGTERLERQVAMVQRRMHRFPHHLRGIGGADGRYVVPSMVAIGPYHHGLPHLQAMEEVKHAAAYSLCRDSGRSVYEKILSVVADARRCYTADDDASLVARLSDAEFAAMMFLDGCFLLQFLADTGGPLFAGRILSAGPSFIKDILLLENQIPWVVLEALNYGIHARGRPLLDCFHD
ncbi:hypothetical protein ACP70R_003571 [Stipagrostis hirtigluma subsp. patula]